MKHYLVAALVVTAALAADAGPNAWAVNTSNGLTFTVQPETIAVNYEKAMWRANVLVKKGGDTVTVQFVVSGCGAMHGAVAMLNPSGKPLEDKQIAEWTYRDNTAMSKIAVLICGTAYQVKMVSYSLKHNTIYKEI